MIFSPNYVVTPEITSLLERIEGYKTIYNSKKKSSQLISSLRESSRLISTYYSMKIEGNPLSIEEVEVVIKQKDSSRNRSQDKIDILNYYKALKYIETNKNLSFTEELIKNIHGLVLYGTPKPSSYRNAQNVIRDRSTDSIIYIPPEAQDISPLMKALVAWVREEIKNKIIPIPIIAFIVHYQILTIHPYNDGNGRIARLLTTFLLQRNSFGLKGTYSLEEFYLNNSNDYYKVLAVDGIFNYYIGRVEADITDFISFLLRALVESFAKINLYPSKPKPRPIVKNSTSQLRVLNVQQRAILTLFAEYREVTSQDISKHLGIKTRNATYLIRKWLNSDFLEIGNAAYKSRTYILNNFWEDFIT